MTDEQKDRLKKAGLTGAAVAAATYLGYRKYKKYKEKQQLRKMGVTDNPDEKTVKEIAKDAQRYDPWVYTDPLITSIVDKNTSK